MLVTCSSMQSSLLQLVLLQNKVTYSITPFPHFTNSLYKQCFSSIIICQNVQLRCDINSCTTIKLHIYGQCYYSIIIMCQTKVYVKTQCNAHLYKDVLSNIQLCTVYLLVYIHSFCTNQDSFELQYDVMCSIIFTSTQKHRYYSL